MSWGLTEHSEVIRGRDDAASEEVKPDPVCHDACGERVVASDHVPREFCSAAALFEGIGGVGSKRFEETSGDGSSWGFGIATDEYDLIQPIAIGDGGSIGGFRDRELNLPVVMEQLRERLGWAGGGRGGWK